MKQPEYSEAAFINLVSYIYNLLQNKISLKNLYKKLSAIHAFCSQFVSHYYRPQIIHLSPCTVSYIGNPSLLFQSHLNNLRLEDRIIKLNADSGNPRPESNFTFYNILYAINLHLENNISPGP